MKESPWRLQTDIQEFGSRIEKWDTEQEVVKHGPFIIKCQWTCHKTFKIDTGLENLTKQRKRMSWARLSNEHQWKHGAYNYHKVPTNYSLAVMHPRSNQSLFEHDPHIRSFPRLRIKDGGPSGLDNFINPFGSNQPESSIQYDRRYNLPPNKMKLDSWAQVDLMNPRSNRFQVEDAPSPKFRLASSTRTTAGPG